jgi:hypothetical protein
MMAQVLQLSDGICYSVSTPVIKFASLRRSVYMAVATVCAYTA